MKQTEETFDAVDIQALEYQYDEILMASKPHQKVPTPTMQQSTPQNPVASVILLPSTINSTILPTPLFTRFLNVTSRLCTPPQNITPNKVESVKFIKYTWPSLSTADDILTFYEHVQAQALNQKDHPCTLQKDYYNEWDTTP